MNDMKIEILNLNKFYGKKKALSDINLTIHKGMFGLLGRNGAGKTTLMKTLATLHKANSGEITVCGVPGINAAQIRKITGYLPQDFSMYPNMKVSEALRYLGILSGATNEELRKKVPELLTRVNLLDAQNKKVKALSGGMKRRLGIAQAILHDPKVLIVDEPTAGLDPEERIRFRNLLCEIAEDRIVILSTHIVGDIEATCEEIAVMDQGHILYHGNVKAFVQFAEGKVYTAEITKKDLPLLKEKYCVVAMLTMGNNVSVRFLAKEMPFDGATACEAQVEDAYMYLMQEKAGGGYVC